MGASVIDVIPSDQYCARAALTTPKGKFTARVEANTSLDQGATGWVAALTPLAMKMRSPIHTNAVVDEEFSTNLVEVQRILASWYHDLHPVPVEAPTRRLEGPAGRGIGSFFSGGVDSFYSALAPEVTHLVFVHGFDIRVDDNELAEKAVASARRAARELGKELIEVRTNIREFSDRSSHWGYRYHGAAMAHIGHLLAEHLETVYFPSSYDEDTLMPWGSHPHLDHLWSSSGVRFVHHGLSTRRVQKIMRLVDCAPAMEHLRVCWLHPNSVYNCGKCEKCIRTVISLQVAGGAGRCRTLPAAVPVEEIAKLPITNHGSLVFAEQNLEALRRSGRNDPELEEALEQCIHRGHRREARRERLSNLVAPLTRR